MIDPFQIATCGVGPGHSTFSFATMGFGFDIEVTIKPVDHENRGSRYLHPLGGQEYSITIRIRYKDKEWEESRIITEDIALSLEKILVWFKSVTIKQYGVAIKNFSINAIKPVVKLFTKK